ncbi:MAG: NifB/NifX family molybdenum-iron cluster-binding protein, partial [Myxococcota bacterium]
MLIAIPSEAPGGLDALISEHFGHCDAFTLVDVVDGEVGKVEVVPNGGHEQGGCMAPVRFLKERNVEALLSGGMGMRPLAGFRSVGIQVFFKEDARTVKEVVSKFARGECRAFGDAQTCGGGSGHCGGHHHHEIERPPIEGRADVQKGRMITIDFVLQDGEGKRIDASGDRGPMLYLQGSGVIPGLEMAIEGLEAGAETSVDLKASEAFGDRDEQRMIEVPRAQLPSDLQVGEVIIARDPSGGQTQLMVA